MDFIHLDTFTNYIDANIIMGRLENEGIRCWLRDENTVTIDPILTQAIGGIKLMVAAPQAERAVELLNSFREQKKKFVKCLSCGSHNIQFVSTPRKTRNWLGAIFGVLLGDYPIASAKVYHCFDCDHEFSDKEMDTQMEEDNSTNAKE